MHVICSYQHLSHIRFQFSSDVRWGPAFRIQYPTSQYKLVEEACRRSNRTIFTLSLSVWRPRVITLGAHSDYRLCTKLLIHTQNTYSLTCLHFNLIHVSYIQKKIGIHSFRPRLCTRFLTAQYCTADKTCLNDSQVVRIPSPTSLPQFRETPPPLEVLWGQTQIYLWLCPMLTFLCPAHV